MPRRGENIRKRKDGRWEGRYINNYDSNGKAKYTSVYGKTYTEVKNKLNNIKRDKLSNKSYLNKKNLNYQEVLYLWLENNQIKMKEATYVKYYRLIKTHIIPEIGDINIKEIDVNIINRFILKKSMSGRLDKDGGLSPTYIRTIAFIIKSSLSFASNNNYCIPLNTPINVPNIIKNKLNIYSINEQLDIEKACLKSHSDKVIALYLSLFIGLRIGEICGLKWSDIDFDQQTIHIQRTVERIQILDSNKNKTKLAVIKTKTVSSDRIIPFPSKLLSFIPIEKIKSNEYVIKGKKYDYTDPRSLQYFYKKFLMKNNIRYINFHALRHTFATRCIESGMDVKSLSEILGHSNVNITLTTYVHSSMEHKRKQIETMINNYGQINGRY